MGNQEATGVEFQMSEEEKQPTEPDEVESGLPAEPVGEEGGAGPSPSPIWAWTGWVQLLVLLGIVAAALVTGYHYGSGMQQSLQRMEEGIRQVEGRQAEVLPRMEGVDQAIEGQRRMFQALEDASMEQQRRMEEERERLEQKSVEMQAALAAVHYRIGSSSSQWMAAEAEYLMRIANHRLRLEGDSATAISALQTADGRLRDTGDPAWIAVREVLAAELSALRAVKSVDLAGIAARLSGLVRQVEGLKLPGRQALPEEAAASQQQSEEGAGSLETLLEDAWEGFKSLMEIRRDDRPVSAMLAPEQRWFLYQNLQLQLQAARLALLRREQPLYDASLTTVAQWLKEFFDPEQDTARSMQAEIELLEGVNVRPEWPDISGSLRALRARLETPPDGDAGS